MRITDKWKIFEPLRISARRSLAQGENTCQNASGLALRKLGRRVKDKYEEIESDMQQTRRKYTLFSLGNEMFEGDD